MTRIHDWLLGPYAPTPPIKDEEAEPLAQVALSPAATQTLRRLLRGGGVWRGGLLWGHASGGTLHVETVTPNAPLPTLLPPLDLDPSYVLGSADALAVAWSGLPLDWIGSWIVRPNGQLSPAVDDLGWWDQGWEKGLFTDRHVLLSVGWLDDALTAVAYAADGDQAQPLPVIIGRPA